MLGERERRKERALELEAVCAVRAAEKAPHWTMHTGGEMISGARGAASPSAAAPGSLLCFVCCMSPLISIGPLTNLTCWPCSWMSSAFSLGRRRRSNGPLLSTINETNQAGQIWARQIGRFSTTTTFDHSPLHINCLWCWLAAEWADGRLWTHIFRHAHRNHTTKLTNDDFVHWDVFHPPFVKQNTRRIAIRDWN